MSRLPSAAAAAIVFTCVPGEPLTQSRAGSAGIVVERTSCLLYETFVEAKAGPIVPSIIVKCTL